MPKVPEPTSKAASRGSKKGWGVLKGAEMKRPGAPLMALLWEEAAQRGMKQSDLAEELGVHYSYLSGLRSGASAIPKIGPELIGRIATFLGLPRIAVMLAAGQLTLADFYQAPDAIANYLLQSLRAIQTDKVYGPITPPEIFELSRPVQLLLISLYEEVRRRNLIPGRVTPEELAERFAALLAMPETPDQS